ncbi:MAG: hypothetical protein U1A72_19235 [Sulfuritalea sp.]|nr:hypothetical protein [Sulfuritalea sp.]
MGAALRKAEGWDVRLARWVDSRRGAVFVWGETDCALLAFEALDAMAGNLETLAGRFRGQWQDRLGALRYQHHHATDARQELEKAGCVPIAPGFQQRGDVLVAPRDGFACAHVCTGRMSLAAWPDLGVHWCDTAAVLAIGAVVLRLPD